MMAASEADVYVRDELCGSWGPKAPSRHKLSSGVVNTPGPPGRLFDNTRCPWGKPCFAYDANVVLLLLRRANTDVDHVHRALLPAAPTSDLLRDLLPLYLAGLLHFGLGTAGLLSNLGHDWTWDRGPHEQLWTLDSSLRRACHLGPWTLDHENFAPSS